MDLTLKNAVLLRCYLKRLSLQAKSFTASDIPRPESAECARQN
jgi:hypothetical protein